MPTSVSCCCNQMQGLEAITDSNKILDLTIGCEFLFEGFDLAPDDMRGRPHKAGISVVQLPSQFLVRTG